MNKLVMVNERGQQLGEVRCDGCTHWDGEKRPHPDAHARCALGIGGLTEASFGCAYFQRKPQGH